MENSLIQSHFIILTALLIPPTSIMEKEMDNCEYTGKGTPIKRPIPVFGVGISIWPIRTWNVSPEKDSQKSPPPRHCFSMLSSPLNISKVAEVPAPILDLLEAELNFVWVDLLSHLILKWNSVMMIYASMKRWLSNAGRLALSGQLNHSSFTI